MFSRSTPFLILLVGLLLCESGHARQAASIHGYISDRLTGETLISANVALLEQNRGTATNSSGYYSIPNIEPGEYTLAASYIGYRLFEIDVRLEAGESRRLDIELIPEDVELEELVVQSEREIEERRNIGIAQIESSRIRELPAVFEPDLFRSVQLLPGVKAASDFSSGLYIRGGSPDQTLILLDETTVYNPSHFFGFYSTFNPDAIKDARLYKGGYPAEYGGRIGSVLTVYNKDGNRNEFQGTATVGMLASRAMLEGPFSRGSWMIAVRRSTLEPLMALLRQNNDNIPDKFYFVDLNGKINFDASPNDRFSLAFYSGGDHVNIPFTDDANIALEYGNRTASANWRHIFSDRLFGRITLTGSHYYNEPNFDIGGTTFQRNNDIYDYSLKADTEYFPDGRHTLSAGIWAGQLTLNYRDRFDGQDTFRNRIGAIYSSAYLQNRWEPTPQWIFEGGIRSSYFSEGEYLRLEPRLSAEHRISDRIRFQAAYGRFYQYLTLITNEAFSGFDIWLTTDEGVSPSYGDQFVLGMKSIPFRDHNLDIELYYRSMRDLFELNPFVQDAAGLDYNQLFRFGEGYAYGFELFFERQAGPLTGFIGYTLGITRRKFPGFNYPILDEPSSARFYPPKYDRTHDVNLIINYELSSRWQLTSVFSYATGQAYTEPDGRTRIGALPWGESAREVLLVDQLNASRLPSYHRLDLSLSRFGSFFGIADAEWQFQVINAYSRQNIWFYQYDFDENPVQRNEVSLLPVLPAISYSVTF